MPAEDHRHLPLLGQADRLAAAGHGVDDHEQPGEHDDEVERASRAPWRDDGGRVDGDPGGEAALQQEEAGAEQTRLLVEPPAEELVGGVDAEPPIHGQEHGAHDDEREGQAEVVLHEADAALEALARDREEGDRARLGGHHATGRSCPSRWTVLPLRYVLRLRTWRVRQEPYAAMPTHGAEQHDPIDEVHEKIRVNTVKKITTSDEPPEDEQVDAAPGAESGDVRAARRRSAGRARGARRHLPSETRFANSRYAPGTAFGELAEPRQAGVDEVALAVPRHEQAAPERRLAGIAGREDRGEALVPLSRESTDRAPAPSPSKSARGDAIRRGQRRMIGRQDRHRRVLIRHAGARDAQVERRGQPVRAESVERVVLRDDRCRLPRRRRTAPGRCSARSVRALKARMPMTTASKAAQPFRRQIGAGQRRDRISHLLQAAGHVVARARQVADAAAANRQLQRHRLQARAGGCRSWSGMWS